MKMRRVKAESEGWGWYRGAFTKRRGRWLACGRNEMNVGKGVQGANTRTSAEIKRKREVRTTAVPGCKCGKDSGRQTETKGNKVDLLKPASHFTSPLSLPASPI